MKYRVVSVVFTTESSAKVYLKKMLAIPHIVNNLVIIESSNSGWEILFEEVDSLEKAQECRTYFYKNNIETFILKAE